MLTGRYYHTIEKTGRVSVPILFREELGNSPVITRGLDGCLFLFSNEEWRIFSQELHQSRVHKKIHRDFSRLMAHDALTLSYDKQGRALIPEYLRERAQLSKVVVFAGSLNKVELWDQETYHNYLEDLEQRAEDIAEQFETRETSQE